MSTPADTKQVLMQIPMSAYVKVIALSFGVEILTMVLLEDLHQLRPMMTALANAVLVAGTLIISLSLWVLPEFRKIHNHLKNEAVFLQTLIEAIPAPVFYKNEEGVYMGCNAQFENYLGRKRSEIVGQTVYGIAPEDLARVYHDADMSLMLFGEDQIYETQVKHADDTEHDVMFHKAIFRKSDGQVGGIIGIILDITERKEMERRLQSLATIDALTGIPNRRELDHRLEQALLRNERTDESLALLFIDMDGFKAVNDLYGHEAGDEVLRQIGERLTKILRKSDVAGRMGGDEFAVLLDTKVSMNNTQTVAEKILSELSAPYAVDGQEFTHLSASIGIALAPKDGNSLKTLLTKADKAMYQAKKSGKNTYCFANTL